MNIAGRRASKIEAHYLLSSVRLSCLAHCRSQFCTAHRKSLSLHLPQAAVELVSPCDPIFFRTRFKPKQVRYLFSRFTAIHSRPNVRVTVVHSSQKLLPTTFLDCMTTCFVKPSRGQSSRMYNCYLADQKSGLFGFKQRVQERRGGLGRGTCGLRNLSCCLSPRY